MQLHLRLAPTKCLTAKNGGTTNGTPLVLQTCVSGAASQIFTWNSVGEIKNGSLCVDDQGGKGANFDAIILYGCHGGINQKWTASTDHIVGINGKCIDDGGYSTADGNPMILYTCHSGTNQLWDSQSASSSSSTTSGVAVYPGQSIQSAVNGHPAGTTFILKAGTHSKQSIVPKSGDTFAGEVGTIMDGGGTVQYAFQMGASPYPKNVTIKGLIIQNYNPPMAMGAIAGGRTDEAASTGWVVRDNEIRYNLTGGAIRLGTHMQVLNNKIHHNAEVGLIGNGDSILVSGNEIAYNNWLKQYTWGFLLGGAKFVKTRWLHLTNNYVHDNYGPGFHTDESNIWVLEENNRIVNNAGPGIFHEISYDAVIRNNTVTGNGFARSWYYGAGILIAHSPNVQVYGNTVSGNAQGIAGIQQDRTAWSAPYGPHYLKNLYVHDNIVTTGAGRGGAVAGDYMLNYIFSSSWNNRFVHNTYTVGTNTKPFEWLSSLRTISGWQGYGQDVTGIFK